MTSHDPTMFWILNSVNHTLKPMFMMVLAYFLHAVLLSSSLLAPVHTILPELKTRAVVFGDLIFMIAAANHLGLYSVFLALSAIFFRSSLHCKLHVETMFCSKGLLMGFFGGSLAICWRFGLGKLCMLI